MIGCGGTSIDFHPAGNNMGIKVIWHNEEAPYEAEDGHNVSYLSPQEVKDMYDACFGDQGNKKRQQRKRPPGFKKKAHVKQRNKT